MGRLRIRAGQGPRPSTTPFSGFTVVELLIVLVVAALLGLVALPKTKTFQDRLRVASAKEQIVSGIAAARGAAVQRGRTAQIVFTSNKFFVQVMTSAGTYANILGPIALDSNFKVTVSPATASDSLISFEPRGFAQPRLS